MREHTFGTANIFWARNASVRGLTSLLNDHFDENPVWEWLPVGPYISPFFTSPWDSDGVCVSGYAVHPHDSVADVPFTHPFTEGGGSSERGNDWNFYIAVDADYNDLLSPCNNDLDGCAPQLGPTDEDNVQAIGIARLRKDQIDPVTKLPGLGLNVAGVLGFEVDGGLVPLILASSGRPAPLRDQYRVAHGDRVIVVGRWIIDCGHDNFATEIHPPLLLIRGFRPIMPDGSADPDTTVCNIISRPFLVDQNFAYYDREIAGYGGPTIRTGRGLRQEIEGQLGSIYWWGGRVQLHTPLLQPFIGSHFIRFTLHPGVARRSPTDQLSVTGSFTVRSGVGILLIGNPGDDSLDVLISLDAAHYAAPQKPPSHVITVTEDELLASLPADKAQVLRDTLQRFKNMSGNIRSAIEAGAQMDVYDAPIPVSPADGSNALNQVPIGEVLGESPTALDDTQLYPVYGSVRLVWKRG